MRERNFTPTFVNRIGGPRGPITACGGGKGRGSGMSRLSHGGNVRVIERKSVSEFCSKHVGVFQTSQMWGVWR